MKNILKCKLTDDYLPEYPHIFPEFIVKKGTSFNVIIFPVKVRRTKGTKSHFVYGKTDDGKDVRVMFSQTDLNYRQTKKNFPHLFA